MPPAPLHAAEGVLKRVADGREAGNGGLEILAPLAGGDDRAGFCLELLDLVHGVLLSLLPRGLFSNRRT